MYFEGIISLSFFLHRYTYLPGVTYGDGKGRLFFQKKKKENEFVKNVEYNQTEFIKNNKSFNLINIYNPG